MKRKSMNGKASRKLFSRTAMNVDGRNIRPPSMRGGYRL